MILICGIPSETPVQLITEELATIGADYLLWNQRKFKETSINFTINENGEFSGILAYENKKYRLEDFSAVYTRITDWTTLPEIEAEPENIQLKKHCENVHCLLQYFIDNCNAVVVNRTEAMMSNNSKPYQMFLAKECGITIPDTLVTTAAGAAIAFYEEHDKKIIYKSASGTRSIVQKLKTEDISRLSRLFYCPTQFQNFIEGQNIRVHVINESTVTTAIQSAATDYRYAGAQTGEHASLHHMELKATNKLKCVRFSKFLDLFFSGLDFKMSATEELCCFEANPMPGYSYYEQSASQPIAYTLACELNEIDMKATWAGSLQKI